MEHANAKWREEHSVTSSHLEHAQEQLLASGKEIASLRENLNKVENEIVVIRENKEEVEKELLKCMEALSSSRETAATANERIELLQKGAQNDQLLLEEMKHSKDKEIKMLTMQNTDYKQQISIFNEMAEKGMLPSHGKPPTSPRKTYSPIQSKDEYSDNLLLENEQLRRDLADSQHNVELLSKEIQKTWHELNVSQLSRAASDSHLIQDQRTNTELQTEVFELRRIVSRAKDDDKEVAIVVEELQSKLNSSIQHAQDSEARY